MDIVNNKNHPSFQNLYNVSQSVQQNAVLNRALIDAGGIFPWLIKSNNKQERTERLINMSTFFGFAFLAPVINVPLANRIAMRSMKLTDSFFDTNSNAIQLSNKFLTNSEDMLKGLDLYNKENKFAFSPLEKLYSKIFAKDRIKNVDINKLIKKCQNNPELLRKRLVGAKNWVLFSDLIITGATLGSLGFLNNYLTKKRTGKSGFSAELYMADPKIIEQRSAKYEQNKKRNIKKLAGIVLLVSSLVPMAFSRGLLSKNSNKFTKFIKNHAKYTDYTKGVFMSRFTMLTGIIMNMSGLLLASRNKTERKDWLIRCLITNPVFLGGDLLSASLISNICDKLLKTKLTEKSQNGNILKSVFPKVKTLEQIDREVKNNELSKLHKPLSQGIYWGNMVLCALMLAYLVPTLCNKMIRNDVNKSVDEEKANRSLNNNYLKYSVKNMDNFIKNSVK